jgi:hypothetical protein
MRLEIDPDAVGVANDLGHLLVQREHEGSFAAARTLGNVLQAHHALANARYAGDNGRAAEEVTAVHHCVEAGRAGGDARGRVERGGLVAACTAWGLHPPVHLEAPAIDDPERVPAHLKVVPARLDDLDRPHRGAEPLFHPQPDDRVRYRFFRQCAATAFIYRRRFDREGGREVLALQPCDEHVKGVAKLRTAECGRSAGDAIHVDAPRTDLRSLLEEQTVGLLQLLAEHLACREDDFQFVLTLERREIPSKARRIAHKSVWRDFEQDDDAGFSEHAGAAIDELDAQRRLAGADPAFQKNDIAPRNPG